MEKKQRFGGKVFKLITDRIFRVGTYFMYVRPPRHYQMVSDVPGCFRTYIKYVPTGAMEADAIEASAPLAASFNVNTPNRNPQTTLAIFG